MKQRGETGSIASVICDSGERYADSYFDDDWLTAQGIDIARPTYLIEQAVLTGEVSPDLFMAQRQRA